MMTHDPFKESLHEWVMSFVSEQEKKRRSYLRNQERESSIRWYNKEIERLKKEAIRRPSKHRQIDDYKRRVRQIELEIAFEEKENI